MFDLTVEIFGYQVNLFAQIFGLGMLIFVALGYVTRDRVYFILTLLGSCCCVMESVVLKAWSSAYAAALVCVRNVLILIYGKRNKKVPPAICWAIIIAVAIGGAIGTVIERDLWAIVPPVLTVADSFFASLRPQKELKIAIIPIAFGYILFNFHVGAYVGVIRQIIAFIAGIAGLIRYMKYLKKAGGVTGTPAEQEEVTYENKT